MTQSVRGQIIEALASRLNKIKQANGYSTDVMDVYYDQIPMGMELADYQLPAIFLLNRVETPQMQHKCYVGMWEFDLQLWHRGNVGDVEMTEYTRDVYKALFADSASADTEGEFRSLHPSIAELIPLNISADLNMIEENRITVLTFRVHYRTKLYNL